MKDVKLILGDCLSKMVDVADSSIDLTLTSPPYDDLRTYNCSCMFSFDYFKDVANQLLRITKTGGVVVWIVNDATKDGSETGTSFRQALFFKEIGFNIHDTMIWQKPTFTATGSLSVRYAPVFEYMFVLSKGKPKTFNPIKDRQNKNAGKKYHGTVRKEDGTFKRVSSNGKTFREYGQRHNVWLCSTAKTSKNAKHPAQFPEQLATDHIISWSNEQDVVLDPFMGSGTTGVSCIKTNRSFIGIEIDKTYYRLAQERIENEKRQMMLF